MENDFYVDEAEFAVACNTAFGLLNCMAASLETYSNILTEVTEKSIKDESICSEIEDIISLASKYSNQIVKLADKLQKKIIAKELCEVEEKNEFVFPDEPNLDEIPVLWI